MQCIHFNRGLRGKGKPDGPAEGVTVDAWRTPTNGRPGFDVWPSRHGTWEEDGIIACGIADTEWSRTLGYPCSIVKASEHDGENISTELVSVEKGGEVWWLKSKLESKSKLTSAEKKLNSGCRVRSIQSGGLSFLCSHSGRRPLDSSCVDPKPLAWMSKSHVCGSAIRLSPQSESKKESSCKADIELKLEKLCLSVDVRNRFEARSEPSGVYTVLHRKSPLVLWWSLRFVKMTLARRQVVSARSRQLQLGWKNARNYLDNQ